MQWQILLNKGKGNEKRGYGEKKKNLEKRKQENAYRVFYGAKSPLRNMVKAAFKTFLVKFSCLQLKTNPIRFIFSMTKFDKSHKHKRQPVRATKLFSKVDLQKSNQRGHNDDDKK